MRIKIRGYCYVRKQKIKKEFALCHYSDNFSRGGYSRIGRRKAGNCISEGYVSAAEWIVKTRTIGRKLRNVLVKRDILVAESTIAHTDFHCVHCLLDVGPEVFIGNVPADRY
mgnify:CR=1 FL=1